MAALLEAGRKVALPARWLAWVDEGFVASESCVFFRAKQATFVPALLQIHHDRTGYECAINKVDLGDFIDGERPMTPAASAALGVAAGRALASQLATFSRDPFRVIVSVDLSDARCTLRFHVRRAGEEWLAPDLDGYANEALAVFD